MTAPKRELLLDTAEAIFSREGFKGISVDRLLREAGVAKMTLYKGFESKDALIEETLKRRGSRLAMHLESYIKAAGAEPEQQILSCFDGMRDWSARPDFNGCYFVNTLAEYGNSDQKIGKLAYAYKVRFLDRLKAICENLQVEEPDIVARSVFLLIEGAIVTHMSLGDSESYARAKEIAAKLLAD